MIEHEPLDFGRTLVVAPHPDDETLGCGGTLSRLKDDSSSDVIWVLVTSMTEQNGYSKADIDRRAGEIKAVAERYGFSETIELGFPAATLDEIPTQELIVAIAEVFDKFPPETLLLPFPNDAHSDHRRSFSAAIACSKWFRRKSIRRIMCYEVPSETGFNFDPNCEAFKPGLYVRLEPRHVAEKIATMKLYAGEMFPFPFPRSEEALNALAQWRGSECGAEVAEAFVALRQTL